MANTYSQIYIHAVFAVKGRENIIRKEFRDEYLELLKRFEVRFDDKYLLDRVEL